MDEKAKSKTDKRRSRLISELCRIKRAGVEARFAAEEVSKRDSMVAAAVAPAKGLAGRDEEAGEERESWLECRVVEEMPLLWIKKTSLTHGTVMLYDGERSVLV